MNELERLELEFLNEQEPPINQTNLNNIIDKINELVDEANRNIVETESVGLPIGATIEWDFPDKPLPLGFFEAGTTGLSGELYPEAYELFKEEDDETGLFDLPSHRLGKVFVPRQEDDPDFGEIGIVSNGSKTHQLVEGELPRHRHSGFFTGGGYVIGASPGSNNGWSVDSGGYQYDGLNVGYTGNNQPHNNIQPSYVGILAYKVYEV